MNYSIGVCGPTFTAYTSDNPYDLQQYHWKAVELEPKVRAQIFPSAGLEDKLSFPAAEPTTDSDSKDWSGEAELLLTAGKPGQEGTRPTTLSDIPSLDKTNGEWVKQIEAAEILGKKQNTLKKERHRGLKASDGLSGISTKNHFWRKESENAKTIWYYKSSLSSNTVSA